MKTLKEYKTLLMHFLPERLIEESYYSIIHNDEAHNTDHVYDVCEYGIQLTKKGIGVKDRSIILAGCLLHDLGCRYDRSSHHIISYGMAFEYLQKFGNNFFSKEQIMLIAKSCMEHRASWSGERSGFHSDYVALADRGHIDLIEFIRRCMLYRMAKGNLNKDDLKQEIFEHLREKCGVDGYMWKSYPALGWELNDGKISGVVCAVDDKALLSSLINDYVENHFKETK